MPAAFALVGLIGGAIGAVGAVVGGIVTAISGVIAPIIGAVSAIVGSIGTLLGSVLGGTINTIGGIVEALSAGLQGGLSAVKLKIGKPLASIIGNLKTAIGSITEAITEPLLPILTPIKESLTSIKDFALEIETWVNTELAPVGELIDIVNTLSAIAFIKQLIEGQADIVEVLDGVEGETGTETVKAIAMLYKDIAEIGIETIKYTREQTVALAKSIDEHDKNLRFDIDTGLTLLGDEVQTQFAMVTDTLSGRITPLERDITMVARRTEDLPYFQDMLIKALA